VPVESRDHGWRRAALAIFLLEELLWGLNDLCSGPRRTLPPTTLAMLAAAESPAVLGA